MATILNRLYTTLFKFLMKTFSLNKIIKILIIFIIGFVQRLLINYLLNVDVFIDFSKNISIFYYIEMFITTFYIGEILDEKAIRPIGLFFLNISKNLSNIKIIKVPADLFMGYLSKLLSFLSKNKITITNQGSGSDNKSMNLTMNMTPFNPNNTGGQSGESSRSEVPPEPQLYRGHTVGLPKYSILQYSEPPVSQLPIPSRRLYLLNIVHTHCSRILAATNKNHTNMEEVLKSYIDSEPNVGDREIVVRQLHTVAHHIVSSGQFRVQNNSSGLILGNKVVWSKFPVYSPEHNSSITLALKK